MFGLFCSTVRLVRVLLPLFYFIHIHLVILFTGRRTSGVRARLLAFANGVCVCKHIKPRRLSINEIQYDSLEYRELFYVKRMTKARANARVCSEYLSKYCTKSRLVGFYIYCLLLLLMLLFVLLCVLFSKWLICNERLLYVSQTNFPAQWLYYHHLHHNRK